MFYLCIIIIRNLLKFRLVLELLNNNFLIELWVLFDFRMYLFTLISWEKNFGIVKFSTFVFWGIYACWNVLNTIWLFLKISVPLSVCDTNFISALSQEVMHSISSKCQTYRKKKKKNIFWSRNFLNESFYHEYYT